MFLKQKKLDSKVRFQHAAFKKQLRQARNYKRPTIKIPDSKLGIWLNKLGLSSWYLRVFVFLILVLFIYIVYIPNIFFVKQINVSGLKTGEGENVRQQVLSYINHKTLWPQNNLLLLSKPRLSNMIVSGNTNVIAVSQIIKKFPGVLNIELNPRVNKYMLQIQNRNFAVSNDGRVMQELVSTSTGENLSILRLQQGEAPKVGDNYLSGELLVFLDNFSVKFSQAANASLAYYELADINSPDLSVYTPGGYRIFFDVKSDADSTLRKLNLLLSQYSEAEKARLRYIDMRFESRGYVCFKNAPCASEAIPVVLDSLTSSSTPAMSSSTTTLIK